MTTPEQTLKINRIKIAIEPNSFSYSDGYPEREGYPDTAGEIEVTEDLATAKSMVKFSFRSNKKNKTFFNEWRSLGKNNVITFMLGDLNTNVSGAFIKNTNVEIPIGSDTTFDVEFVAPPVTQQ